MTVINTWGKNLQGALALSIRERLGKYNIEYDCFNHGH